MFTMRSSAALAIAIALSTLGSTSAKAVEMNLQSRQQQQPGTPLFLDEPACGFYQCDITWYPGQNVTAHWLDAPEGNVILDMMADAGATFAYNVATVPGTTTNCDSEGQKTCGQFSWIVPSAWVNGSTYGNYSLRASSQSNQSVESYTDIILVKPSNGTKTNIPFKALDPVAAGTGNSSSTSSSSSSSTTSGSPASTGAGSGSGTQSGQTGSTSETHAASKPNSSASFANVGQQAVVAFTAASLFAAIALTL
ncbi:uncharacterized protein FA14DRAFT_42180 [Meira miltonrushii]|uniref:Secreted protein n=1 Tax=Meira miltonrushii TaxID=1280837 RepID=A0A316VGL2_9BASI|nr:uncharacterized protein FA14DRAFT_42180 [Meira miltonrushii]PWN35463.1 hypothetical protein FA14DRAFT_42180 [Meira miltonrushii]